VQRYDAHTRQARINLGSEDGLGTYDQGQIALTLEGESRNSFVDATVEVVQLTPSSALVQVQEKQGIDVPVQVGARVLMNTNSGVQARRTITDQCLAQANGNQLPAAYSQSYCLARNQPSPETYYNFAAIQLDYEQPENTLRWLNDAETQFPETKAINDVYEAVALTDLNRPQQGLSLLETVRLQEGELKQEVKSYILSKLGDWQGVMDVADQAPSAATWNNRLIAQYCQELPKPERETDVLPNTCPVAGGSSFREPSQGGRETIERMAEQAARRYPRDPYMLNTLGFISLQLEDYSRAYQYYQQLAQMLNYVDENNAPPHLQDIKANTITYLNNYNQNYALLHNRNVDLGLLRAQQRQITSSSAIEGGIRVVDRVSRGAGLFNIFSSVAATGAEIAISERNASQIRQEQQAILDQMRITFLQGVQYVAARPNLTLRELQTEVVAQR
jgi:tetratricopeptide (TPR) repeat protein